MFLFESDFIFFIESEAYWGLVCGGMFCEDWAVGVIFYLLMPVRFMRFFSSCRLSLATMILLSVMFFSISKFISCLGISFDELFVLFDDSIRFIDGVLGGILYSVELSDYLPFVLGGS